MGSDDSKRNNVEVAYGQVAKVAEIFWEWRHKVLTRFFAASAGMLVVAGWFYKDPELRAWTFMPLLAGACFSVISYLLDRINTHVLRECYRLASELEDKMIDGGGIFKCIKTIHYQKGSYHGILRFVYLGTAAVFSALVVFTFLFCDLDEGEVGSGAVLDVSGEAPGAVEPAKGVFDEMATR